MEMSGDGNWKTSTHEIVPDEHGTSVDIQICSKGTFPNDMAFYITNQYDEAVPFFSIPIGGIPKYKYKIDVIYEFD